MIFLQLADLGYFSHNLYWLALGVNFDFQSKFSNLEINLDSNFFVANYSTLNRPTLDNDRTVWIYEMYKTTEYLPMNTVLWGMWNPISSLLAVEADRWERRIDLTGVHILCAAVDVRLIFFYKHKKK